MNCRFDGKGVRVKAVAERRDPTLTTLLTTFVMEAGALPRTYQNIKFETDVVKPWTDAVMKNLSKDSEAYQVAEKLHEMIENGEEISTKYFLSEMQSHGLIENLDLPDLTKKKNGKTSAASAEAAKESTSVDDNPATHTAQEMQVIEEYKNSTDGNLRSLFSSVIDESAKKFSRQNIGVVSERQATDAAKLIGGDYTGYTNAINSNGARHIMKEHGPNGTVDHSLGDLDDASRIGYILNNYDSVEVVTYASGDFDTSAEFRNADNEPAPMLRYSKKVNGTYYVVEAIPESQYKKFWVVSAYIEKTDGLTQARNAQSPASTPKASLASQPSVNANIAQSAERVKTAAQSATEHRAELVQAANPDAEVLTSEILQKYLDAGVPLETARKAAGVLEGITDGEITSENITNRQIDALNLYQTKMRNIAAQTLGVELHKGSLAEMRREFKTALRQYEARETAQIEVSATRAASDETNASETATFTHRTENTAETISEPAERPIPIKAGADSSMPETRQTVTEQADAVADTVEEINQSTAAAIDYSEFEQEYLQENPDASPADVAFAYQDALQGRSDEGAAVQEGYGVVRDEYSEQVEPELVEVLDEIAELFGVRIRFDSLPDDNGQYHKSTGEIVLDIDAVKPFKFVAGHEIVHRLRVKIDEKAWRNFENYAVEAMGGKKAVAKKQASNEEYAKASVAREEVACDFLGKLISDKEMLNDFCEAVKKYRIQTETVNKLVKIIREIFASIHTVVGRRRLTSKVAQNFNLDEKAARETVKALQEVYKIASRSDSLSRDKKTTDDGGVKKMIREDFSSEIDAWDGASKKVFKVGTTSKVLQSIGVKSSGITWHGGKISEIMKKHPAMTKAVIKQVPQILENPVIVLSSKNYDSRLVMFGTVTDKNGTPVTAILELQPKTKGGQIMNMTVVASAYGKNGSIKKFVEGSGLVYLDPDKKRTEKWMQSVGLQLPSDATAFGSVGSITYPDGVVKIESVPYKQYTQKNIKRDVKVADAAYMDAVKKGNMETAQKMVDEAAKAAGYTNSEDWRMDHKAPRADDGYSNRIDQIDHSYGGDGSIYSAKAAYYYGDGRQYDQRTINIIRSLRNNPDKMVTIYRAVPTDIQDSRVRNGDWVAITKDYAQEHGERIFDEDFRIIENRVPAKYLYGNGDSIHEWGYDNGNVQEVYKNALGNVKLSAVTYDDNGDVIQLSERFDESKKDIRYDKKEPDASYAAQVDKVRADTHDPNNHIYMGTTPVRLVNILGLPKLPMMITPNHIYSVAVSEQEAKQNQRYHKGAHYHALGWDAVKKLPAYIGDPALIIKSNTDPEDARFVVVTNHLDGNGDPIIAAIKPDALGHYLNIDIDTTMVLSTYGKKHIRDYLARAKTENRVLYVDKKRSHSEQQRTGLQLSNTLLSVDFTKSLSQFLDLVNKKFDGTAFANDSGSKKLRFNKKTADEAQRAYYSERYGTELTTEAQTERAAAREKRRAETAAQMAKAGEELERTDALFEEVQSKAVEAKKPRIVAKEKAKPRDISDMSRAELAEQLRKAERDLKAERLLRKKSEAQMTRTAGSKTDPTGVYSDTIRFNYAPKACTKLSVPLYHFLFFAVLIKEMSITRILVQADSRDLYSSSDM